MHDNVAGFENCTIIGRRNTRQKDRKYRPVSIMRELEKLIRDPLIVSRSVLAHGYFFLFLSFRTLSFACDRECAISLSLSLFLSPPLSAFASSFLLRRIPP